MSRPVSALAPARRQARSVLVLRPDRLGDVVLYSGVLPHLRPLYPRAELTVAARDDAIALLAHSPHVDRLVRWEEVRDGGRGADVVLLPVRSPTREMHRVVRKLRARWKYGIAGELNNQRGLQDRLSGLGYTERLRESPADRAVHELEINRRFLAFLGRDVTVEDVYPQLHTGSTEREWAQRAVPCDSRFTLALCPSASQPSREYPADGLAAALGAAGGGPLRVVLFGAAEDAACASVASALEGDGVVEEVVDLSGATTPVQLAEGLRRCDAVLAVDSGPLHMAIALGLATVGILGGGHYGRFFPWGDASRNRFVNRPMDCYWCRWKCRWDTIRCIQEIPPETIGRELADLRRSLRP